MDAEEFRVWLDYHSSAIPGLAPWMLTKGQGVRPHWERTLEKVSLAAAKSATDGLVDGTYPSPKGYGETAKTVRMICMQLELETTRHHVVTRENCDECENTGIINVWNHKCVVMVRKETFERKNTYICVTRCPCSHGDRYSQLPEYNDLHYCRLELSSGNMPSQVDFDNLEQFAYDASKSPNYHSEFADWS